MDIRISLLDLTASLINNKVYTLISVFCFAGHMYNCMMLGLGQIHWIIVGLDQYIVVKLHSTISGCIRTSFKRWQVQIQSCFDNKVSYMMRLLCSKYMIYITTSYSYSNECRFISLNVYSLLNTQITSIF